MKQSPSCESISHVASQETSIVMWNPKVYYRVHMGPPLDPILSQINPFHTFPLATLFLLRSIAVIPFISRSSEWYLLFRFANQNAIWISHIMLECYSPNHLILIIFGKVYELWNSSLCTFFQPLATFFSEFQTFFTAPCSHKPSVFFR